MSKKKDVFNGERPHGLTAVISYIERDDQNRVTPRIYISPNETIWAKPDEDMWGKLMSVFEQLKRMLMENAKTGSLCFLAEAWEFHHAPTADERIDLLRSARFTRDQIETARKVLDSVEEVLDKEGANDC